MPCYIYLIPGENLCKSTTLRELDIGHFEIYPLHLAKSFTDGTYFYRFANVWNWPADRCTCFAIKEINDNDIVFLSLLNSRAVLVQLPENALDRKETLSGYYDYYINMSEQLVRKLVSTYRLDIDL